MHPFNNIALQAARSASRIIVRSLDRLDTIKVSEKDRNDFVTEVDKAAEQEIIEAIRKAYPNHGIIAEESGHTKGDEYSWIIDPLDGTNNFMHGFPHFSISIAVRKKDHIETAMIYDPLRNELFTAVRGKGAHLDNRRIRVSSNKDLSKALIGTGFPFRGSALERFHEYVKVFANLVPKTSGVRRAGSAALDLAYVAAGRLDGFWESDLHIWDIAAGELLITEAGGKVTDFNGKPEHLNNGSVVAGNLSIHQSLLTEINAQ